MAVWRFSSSVDQQIYGCNTWTARTPNWMFRNEYGETMQNGIASTDRHTGIVVMLANGQIGFAHATQAEQALLALGLREVS